MNLRIFLFNTLQSQRNLVTNFARKPLSKILKISVNMIRFCLTDVTVKYLRHLFRGALMIGDMPKSDPVANKSYNLELSSSHST
mgnify:CR=1 FL=1